MVTAINTHPPITTTNSQVYSFFAGWAHCATCNIVLYYLCFGLWWSTFAEFNGWLFVSFWFALFIFNCTRRLFPLVLLLPPSLTDTFPQFIFIHRFFSVAKLYRMEFHWQLTTPHTYNNNNCKISILFLFTWMSAEISFDFIPSFNISWCSLDPLFRVRTHFARFAVSFIY